MSGPSSGGLVLGHLRWLVFLYMGLTLVVNRGLRNALKKLVSRLSSSRCFVFVLSTNA